MNADASKFSLTAAETVIKQKLGSLSLHRVGDYLQRDNYNCQIGAVMYQFKCWPKHISVPVDLSPNWKALAIDITDSREHTFTLSARPEQLQWEQLLVVLPKTDRGTSVLWALKRLDLIAAPDNRYAFEGEATVNWINDEIFKKINLPTSFPARFWESVRGTIEHSRKLFEIKITDLREFDTLCVTEWAKLQAQALIQKSAPLQEELQREVAR